MVGTTPRIRSARQRRSTPCGASMTYTWPLPCSYVRPTRNKPTRRPKKSCCSLASIPAWRRLQGRLCRSTSRPKTRTARVGL